MSLYTLIYLSLTSWQAMISAINIIIKVDFAFSKGYYSRKAS